MKRQILLNKDNMDYWSDEPFQFIYADYIFENSNFAWVDHGWSMLDENGVFAIHSDHQNFHRLKCYVEDNLVDYHYINEIITYQNWGGRGKREFGKKHDYILVFSKGKEYYFNGDAVKIPKQMTNPAFNPSGKETTLPTTLWHDLGNFSTTSSERVKDPRTGKNIKWQKPLKIMRRLMYAFVPQNSRVLDMFLGSGTTAVIAKELGCDFVGIEKDPLVFDVAFARLVVSE